MPERNGTTEPKTVRKRSTSTKGATEMTMESRESPAAASTESAQPSSGMAKILTENPLPLAMLWVGASWLGLKALSGGKATSPLPADAVKDKMDTATAAAGETVGQVVSTTQDVVGRLVGGAQGAFVTIAQGAPRKAGEVTTAIGTRATQAQTTAGRVFEENPLLLSAAAIAGGVALALATPTTKAESEALAGPTKQLVERAETLASQAVDSIEQSASSRNGG